MTSFNKEDVNTSNQVEVPVKTEHESTQNPIKPKTTKEITKEYFADTPVLADIAFCESRYTQFNSDGSIHRGEQNPKDVGVMQINEKYHLDTATKLGYDIYSLEGNMGYAKYLYKHYGTKPWNYSSHCWNKDRVVAVK